MLGMLEAVAVGCAVAAIVVAFMVSRRLLQPDRRQTATQRRAGRKSAAS